jgi:hypothetical protein
MRTHVLSPGVQCQAQVPEQGGGVVLLVLEVVVISAGRPA